MKKIMITLPQKIYFLKTVPDAVSNSGYEEFSIYYENIIYPYSDVYDVEVKSPYGNDFKRFWRISDYGKDDPFDVTFKVYAPYGELLCKKTVTMIPVDKHIAKAFDILCIGDSMTRSVSYMEHIQSKLYDINFKGTRSFNGILYHEGRGGWTSGNYLTKTGSDPSPFLFPKGVQNYYGDMDFYKQVQNYRDNIYTYAGYHNFRKISDGECYSENGKLYSSDSSLLCGNIEWEFSFDKYIKRYNIGHLDAVSLLFGANDLQITEYSETDAHVKTYIENLDIMISSIREHDPSIKIIINTPVPGADQNAWGMRACLGSSNRYKYNMMKLAEAIIAHYENKPGIYISPMSACIDTIYGFAAQEKDSSRYNTEKELFQNNWVHPQKPGYFQMGDALAAVIEKIRES